ncbi:hypothetical protein TRFO_14615 [Tritrichomonas foetus]|uniref:Uncharacterized protein n=1 Tax=Tritrichomonas foetus TaxID=1144522 RepID=A0A1J4KZ35_9EUKA|nr:hypothetical protein TRFO_14615 [Tritrichomonas foetus]|eukprot:OHT14956.1 hypothetical protein TRFO_14615 [Tritrichomonas foetus]
MLYKKECKISSEGFVIPDFDFDSADAVIPISTPSITQYEFDSFQLYLDLLDAMKHDKSSNFYPSILIKALKMFTASIISQKNNIPNELLESYDTPGTLLSLIDPNTDKTVFLEALHAAIAWTGAVKNNSAFSVPEFILFLIETSVYALSDPNFQYDRNIGNSTVALLRNILFHSNDAKFHFINNRGVELFSSLYLEVVGDTLKDYIIIVIINSLDVSPTPPFNFVKFVENPLLKSVFGYNLRSATSLEIRLALAYVKISPECALSFLNHIEIESSGIEFLFASTDTQVLLLELFEFLVTCSNETVVSIAEKKIQWNVFLPHIPMSFDSKLMKKTIQVAVNLFKIGHYKILDTLILKVLLEMMTIGNIKIKHRAMDAIRILINSGSPHSMDSIIGHNIISKICNFLESDRKDIFKFCFEMLLFIIQFALDGKCPRKVRDQLYEAEFEAIMEEVCGCELNEELANMADILKEKFDQLVAESETLEMAELENNHEIIEEEDYDDDEENEFHDNHFDNMNYYQQYAQNCMKGIEEEDESENESDDEEEDEWVDADEFPID